MSTLTPPTPETSSPPVPDAKPHLHRREGEACLIAFQQALAGAGLYQEQNPTYLAQVTRFARALRAVMGEEVEELRLRIHRDACFGNGVFIRCCADSFAKYREFVRGMESRRLGEICFRRAVTIEQLAAFIQHFRRLPAQEEANAETVTEWLARTSVTTIEVAPLLTDETANFDDPATMRQKSKWVYFSAISITREAFAKTNKRSLNLRKAKRLILNAVGLIMKDESALLGLATIKRYDDYTFNHSVNVAIYALGLGNRLGLPARVLNDLGLAALFHDIGKMEIPREILNKVEPLTEQEWARIREHPVLGARTILRLRGWDSLAAHMTTVAYEHHLRQDLTGYPPVARQQPGSLFSRIITLADVYDSLVRPRPYRTALYTSEQCLAILLNGAGSLFDPILVKLFINMIGIYPLGALVALNTGEMGIVVKIPLDPEQIAYPHVHLITCAGGEIVKGAIVDLADQDPATRQYLRRITGMLDPHAYGINVEEFYI